MPSRSMSDLGETGSHVLMLCFNSYARRFFAGAPFSFSFCSVVTALTLHAEWRSQGEVTKATKMRFNGCQLLPAFLVRFRNPVVLVATHEVDVNAWSH